MWRGVNPGSKATSISLVLSAIVLVQVGSAIATTLFDELGPTGTVLLRLLLSSIVLLAIWRPSLAALRGEHRLELLAFAITLAGMNTSFYLAIDRIPLGIGVTLEFIGPLGVAFAASSLRADLLWASLAGAGILLLSPMPGGDLDLLGVAFAVLAGGFWAAYIVLSARVGRSLAGGQGLALAMLVATAFLIVPGTLEAGDKLLHPALLGAAFAVAMLSSAIPYSFEMEALRRLPQGVFGVLMSLEPAVAAAVGFLLLDQGLATREVLAIGLVVAASAGALRSAPPGPEA